MLTQRQQDTYEFIRWYYRRHGCAPKQTEIAKGIGIRSKGVVHRYLKAIADEGLIRLERRHRGIVLNKGDAENFGNDFSLPVLGKIVAGKPIEAITDTETLDLAELLLGANRFALKVQGDSMVDAGIMDGDLVIVERQDFAKPNDMIVALIDNGEATLKRFVDNGDGTITLTPANAAMQSMTYAADRVSIQGVVIGQLRTYPSGKKALKGIPPCRI